MAHRLHELSDEDRKDLRKVKRVIEIFRNLDQRMPSSYMDAFLAVATDPGKGPTAYAKDLNMVQPIAARVLLEIGPKARSRDEPLALVDRQNAPDSLRDLQYFLTPKGRKVMNDMLKALRD